MKALSSSYASLLSVGEMYRRLSSIEWMRRLKVSGKLSVALILSFKLRIAFLISSIPFRLAVSV
jgi:hypothetical protein